MKRDSLFELHRIILSISGMVFLSYFLLFSSDFLSDPGPFGFDAAFAFARPTLVGHLPLELLRWLPYWDGHSFFWIVLHLGLYLALLLKIFPVVTASLLLLLSHFFLNRFLPLLNGGAALHLLHLTFLIAGFRFQFLRLRLLTFFYFSLMGIYFSAGISKDLEAWFINGTAIDSFIGYYVGFYNTSVTAVPFSSFLSRLVYFVEILIPLILVMMVFSKRRYFVVECLGFLFLMSLHIGAGYLFPLDTFGITCILLLLLCFLGRPSEESKPIMILTIVSVWIFMGWFSFQYKGLLYPYLSKWEFFSEPSVVSSRVAVFVTSKTERREVDFSKSSHWIFLRRLLGYEVNNEVEAGFTLYLRSRGHHDVHFKRP